MTPQDWKRIGVGLFAAGLGLVAFFMTLALLQHTAQAQMLGGQKLGDQGLRNQRSAARPANFQANIQASEAITADISVTKTNDLTEVVPSMTVIYYTVTVRNNSTNILTDVVLVDYLPTFYKPLGAIAFGFNVRAAKFITFEIGQPVYVTTSLNPGGALSLVFSGTIDAQASGILTNTAMITTPEGVTDPDPTNNTATDADPISVTVKPNVTPEGVLQISQTDGVTQVVTGQAITYTIIVTNPTAFSLDDVRITDTLPAGFVLSRTHADIVDNVNATIKLTNSKTFVTGTVNLSPHNVLTLSLIGAVQFSPLAWLTNTATVAASPEMTKVVSNSATDVDAFLDGMLLSGKTYLPLILTPGSQ